MGLRANLGLPFRVLLFDLSSEGYIMLTLSLAALAFLPSANALVRKDGVVGRLLLSKLTPKELLIRKTGEITSPRLEQLECVRV